MTINIMISVIMSIYNEPDNYIIEAVNSILKQTYRNFEFIIINDNPMRTEVADLLNGFQDSRIKYYVNQKNIGLALSMNRAITLSLSEYIARMDADDIACPTRLDKQIKKLNEGYDFVFSRYNHIDETSNLIDVELTRNQTLYDEKTISKLLHLKNIVHHPTVMMRKSKVLEVGGYRDFPCSQDYDLWLRLLEYKCTFFMMGDFLLNYRINPNSVSAKKWYQQQLTLYYIFNLSIERLKNKLDSYSKENYIEFLNTNRYQDKNKSSKLKKTIENLSRVAVMRSQKKWYKALFLQFYAIISSKDLLVHYYKVAQKKFLMKND